MSIKRDLLKEKLFDPKLFNTLYINKADEDKVRAEQMEVLIELLCDPRHKGAQTEVFNLLKREPKAVDLLIKAIGEAKGDKKKLIATCWEANIDCDRYITFFANVVINDELSVALEALTTIENMGSKAPAEEVALSLANASESYKAHTNTPKGQIIADLIEVLRRWQA